jgi:hypothetical protein
MATQYCLVPTSAEAFAKSKAHWERVLGRPAYPEDTQYLWGVMTNPDTDESMLVVQDIHYSQVWPQLTPEEQAAMDASLVPESDPRVQAIIASQPKPPAPE